VTRGTRIGGLGERLLILRRELLDPDLRLERALKLDEALAVAHGISGSGAAELAKLVR